MAFHIGKTFANEIVKALAWTRNQAAGSNIHTGGNKRSSLKTVTLQQLIPNPHVTPIGQLSSWLNSLTRVSQFMFHEKILSLYNLPRLNEASIFTKLYPNVIVNNALNPVMHILYKILWNLPSEYNSLKILCEIYLKFLFPFAFETYKELPEMELKYVTYNYTSMMDGNCQSISQNRFRNWMYCNLNFELNKICGRVLAQLFPAYLHPFYFKDFLPYQIDQLRPKEKIQENLMTVTDPKARFQMEKNLMNVIESDLNRIGKFQTVYEFTDFCKQHRSSEIFTEETKQFFSYINFQPKISANQTSLNFYLSLNNSVEEPLDYQLMQTFKIPSLKLPDKLLENFNKDTFQLLVDMPEDENPNLLINPAKSTKINIMSLNDTHPELLISIWEKLLQLM